MKRETVIPKKKKRGPAPTGKGEPVMVRFRPVQMLALDAWIKRQEDQPSRPEAIRRLVELALAGARPMNPMAAAKASDMAAQQIDRLANPSLPEEERQARKRRLIKGPKEFRDMRRDLPKAKR